MRLILITLLGLCFTCSAQTSYQFGALPAININKNIFNDWKLNFKTESRQLLKEGFFNEENVLHYDYILTDFSIITSKKTGLNNALAGGYLLRIQGKNVIHRLIQQFTMTKKYASYRMAHRFSADQTFAQDERMELRLRYRLTAEFPLNGQAVDPKEFYVKVNNEYLNAFQEKIYDLELRVVPLLGYGFTDNNKLEFGLDYRINSFINNASRSSFWMRINWFIKL